MFILGIDTSNTTLSVALVENDKVLAKLTEQTKNDHSKRLMPAIEALFNECDKTPKDLDAIAVAYGPGSYTGVRIGVTVAKTLAWTLKKPLFGISSLKVLALNLQVNGVVIPLFDARRETVFAGAYDGMTHESIIEDGHYELRDLLQKLKETDQKLLFIGTDAIRFTDLINESLGEQAIIVEELEKNLPQADKLACYSKSMQPVEDVHAFVPVYHRLPEAEINWLAEQKRAD